MAPYVRARSNLLFTTTRALATHYTKLLLLRIEPIPGELQALIYYQLWHDRTHRSVAAIWLRRLIVNVAVVTVREAVIRAHDVAVIDPPLAERRAAMRTDIARADELPVRAEHDQRLVEQRYAEGFVGDVGGERHRMPVTAENVPVVAIESAIAG
jgi:hypothetical protein